jgi:CRISPR-associated protein Cas1
MSTLYVQLQGAQVRRNHDQIVVVHQGKVIERVPRRTVERVVVMGRGVQLSTALLIDLLAEGIPVVMTNQQGSRHYATLQHGPSSAGALRMLQYERARDSAWRLAAARRLVQHKLVRQRQLLTAQPWPPNPAALATLLTALRCTDSADTLDSLRGCEGSGAAAYFAAWRRGLPPALHFTGRAYRPPPDPINALLSFGYTLLLGSVTAALQQTGLDPYLGCFHEQQDGRASLALDLMEPYRPLLVDRLVLRWVTEGTVNPTLFEVAAAGDAGQRLTADGRRRFIAEYERQLKATAVLQSGEQITLRRLLLLDAQAFARAVRLEQKFVSYLLEHEVVDAHRHQL